MSSVIKQESENKSSFWQEGKLSNSIHAHSNRLHSPASTVMLLLLHLLSCQYKMATSKVSEQQHISAVLTSVGKGQATHRLHAVDTSNSHGQLLDCCIIILLQHSLTCNYRGNSPQKSPYDQLQVWSWLMFSL